MINKYKKIYDAIINKRKKENVMGYSEKHHIIPKCLGGEDSNENIVRLTAREHYICHYLLTKIYKSDTIKYHKLINAFLMMVASPTHQHKRYTSKLYEYNRIKYSKYKKQTMRGSHNHQYGKIWICDKNEKINKKIDKNDNIPDGWVRGRNLWKKDIKKEKKTQEKITNQIEIDEARKDEYLKLYNQYVKGGYKSIREFARSNNYNKSHVTLTRYWNMYVT